LLNVNIELLQPCHHQVTSLCHQVSGVSVISSIAKDDHLFKIYQSDFTKNWSIFSLSQNKSISVFDAFSLRIVIFSHGAKTVLLEARLDTSTNQVIK
jgi:hypothetical protein